MTKSIARKNSTILKKWDRVPRSENLLHMLTRNDFSSCLDAILKDNPVELNYVQCPIGPFKQISVTSSAAVLTFLQAQIEANDYQIMHSMKLQTFYEILGLPGETGKQIIELFCIEDTESFADQKNAVLTDTCEEGFYNDQVRLDLFLGFILT